MQLRSVWATWVSKPNPKFATLRERSEGQLRDYGRRFPQKARRFPQERAPRRKASARYSPEAEDLGAARSDV